MAKKADRGSNKLIQQEEGNLCAGAVGVEKDDEVEDPDCEVEASVSDRSPSALCRALAISADKCSRSRASSNRSQAVLQRWLDADCL
jgi:hypothetical protein